MEPISTTLFALYRGTPFHNDWLAACLEGAWPSLLGKKAAAFCRPLAVRESNLIVEVSDRAWLEALTSMKADVLRRIRSAAGNEIKGLELVLKEPC